MNAETPKRKTLGRGLNALFGEQDDTTDSPPQTQAVSKSTNTLPVEMLAPSPLQPRKHFDETALNELAASIRERGILQPLLVRADALNPGHYEIIAGERRWRAAQRAQLHNVPVLVRELSDAEVLEVALIENLQRQDLSPVEEARGYQRLLDEFSHTQEEIGEIVGKSRTHVANVLRLLQLPDNVQRMIEDGKLNAGQARPLVGLKNAEALAFTIVRRGMSARQAERLAKSYGKTKRVSARADKDADTRALEQTLEDATGYHVDIKYNGKSGKVVIGYASLEQLDDIVKRLSTGGRRPKSDTARDPATMDIEELLARDEPDARSNHTDAYEDPRAHDVGADGAIHRDAHQSAPEPDADHHISDALKDDLHEDRGGLTAQTAPHEDAAAGDVGSGGATHR
jgi:ParB family transcriptional regulator, chromosome partitioning protein